MSHKKIAVLMDGGFLRAQAKKAMLKYTNDLIEDVAKQTFDPLNEDLLKILYYDSPPFSGTLKTPISRVKKEFKPQHEWLSDLSAREYFAVRCGTVKFNGWLPQRTAQGKSREELSDDDFYPNFSQKGVDIRIGLDIARFSHQHLVDRIILITGDTDLIPAMKYARILGVQVVGIELPNFKLSKELRAHLDIFRLVAWPQGKNG